MTKILNRQHVAPCFFCHIFVHLLLFRQVYAEEEELPQYVEALDSVNREYYPSQQVGS